MNAPPRAATDRTAAHVLALNSGSSSLKFGLYRVGPAGADRLAGGAADAIGGAGARFDAVRDDGRGRVSETAPIASQRAAIERIAAFLADPALPAPQAVGHRIVHGGPTLRRHSRIDAAVLDALDAAGDFAPLHTPPALAVVRYALAHFAGLPQVACLDTAFHAQMPEVASVLPIPAALRDQGLRRYGFHGLSCESIVHRLGAALPRRTLIAHLGHGASVTAVRDGTSVDTSMGLTPSGGIVMGTRSGDLDPGVLVHLARCRGFDAAMLEDLVDHRGGLLAISGLSGDMRTLHAAAAADGAGSDAARLAIRIFCQSVRKQLAAMTVVLDGVDLIVFTGGIGENDAAVRAEICAGLGALGVGLDAERNRAGADPIGDARSRCAVRVLASREDEQIARHAWALA